jgi:rhodanese-related sulfurtransferase
MTQEELKARLESPEFIILDVRKKPDWDTSSRKIRGAIHEDYEGLKEWAGKYPRDKTLVLYCA